MSRRRRHYRRNIDVLTDAEKAEYDKQSSLRFKVNVVTTVGSLLGLAAGFMAQKSLCAGVAQNSPLGLGAGAASPPPATPAPAASLPSWACTFPLLPLLGLGIGGALAYKLA